MKLTWLWYAIVLYSFHLFICVRFLRKNSSMENKENFDIFTLNIKLNQRFSNILVMWRTTWQLQMLLLRLWKQLTTMDYEMPSLSDILWVWLARFASMAWSIVLESNLILPDHWRSCNLSEITLIIWLLYCDQMHLHFEYNKCFWLLLQHYGPVQNHQA